ncbi:ran guanine nucleotide release factor [Heptranchias perlo]|uniref:ran guanine nucleotide release factor n=1 Tax=Heptranchias perlo TaxID=212740 RepID=UPI00355A7983
MATNGTHSHPLFGGSFSAVLPPNSIDVSDIREIPDNQEVFIHSKTDQSIIIELLEHQSQVPDQDAARYHFDDVTTSNNATGEEGSEILSVEPVSGDQIALQELSSAWFLTGRQRVAKFNEQARNTVTIHLALFRLPQYSTDILITFNDPTIISPLSSSTGAESALTGGTSSSPVQHWTLEHFQTAVQSFRLLDPAVFT